MGRKRSSKLARAGGVLRTVSRLCWGEAILVDHSVLHDHDKVLSRILEQIDIRDRIAVDEQQIGERAFSDDAELSWDIGPSRSMRSTLPTCTRITSAD
jgi:hypothetical protein